MTKRMLFLVLLCVALAAPVRAGANHEVPHPEPLVQPALRLLANALPTSIGGWLHVDMTNRTWTLDCRHPSMPPEIPSNCPFTLAGDLDLDPHYGPLSDPGCSIPRGYGGSGESRLGGFFLPILNVGTPADSVTLSDARFLRTPVLSIPPSSPLPTVLAMEGQWSDAQGRADRFEAVFQVVPTAPTAMPALCAGQGVAHLSLGGWVWFAGVLR